MTLKVEGPKGKHFLQKGIPIKEADPWMEQELERVWGEMREEMAKALSQWVKGQGGESNAKHGQD